MSAEVEYYATTGTDDFLTVSGSTLGGTVVGYMIGAPFGPIGQIAATSLGTWGGYKVGMEATKPIRESRGGQPYVSKTSTQYDLSYLGSSAGAAGGVIIGAGYGALAVLFLTGLFTPIGYAVGMEAGKHIVSKKESKKEESDDEDEDEEEEKKKKKKEEKPKGLGDYVKDFFHIVLGSKYS